MDPAAAVKGQNAFFSFPAAEIIVVGRSAGIRSGNSTCGESAPHASAEILQAKRGEPASMHACGGPGALPRRLHDGFTMDPAAAVPDAQHGEGGGSFLYACGAPGASMRLHAVFAMDPTPARGPDRVPSRSGCGKRRGSPASLPPAGKFPMPQKRARRACRSTGGGTGRRAIGDQMEGKGSGGSSGCDRPRRPDAHAHAGHASRTLFANATAAIFLRRICYCRIFLCRYSPLQLIYCRICLCSYYVGHNATAAIFYRRYYCYCSYTHITYS